MKDEKVIGKVQDPKKRIQNFVAKKKKRYTKQI